jgi:hypothetical protein
LAAGLVLFASLAVAACEGGAFANIGVENDTGVPLHFYLNMVNGGRRDYPLTLQPGARGPLITSFSSTSLETRNGCTVGDLVALNPQGREIARRKPPLCVNEIWTVTVDGASPGPASSK